MKIVGRILIILAVLALVMGITYVIVNTRGSSAPGFEPGNERFSASNGAPPGFPKGGRPEFPGRRSQRIPRRARRRWMAVGSAQEYCNYWHHRGIDCRTKIVDTKTKKGNADPSWINRKCHQ